MNLTAQQVDFIAATVDGTCNVSLVARAGSGKTSTILAAVDALVQSDPSLEIVVCAYNKSIANEITEKLKRNGHNDWRRVSAKTIHAMGFEVIRSAYGQVKLDDRKVRTLLRNDEAWHPAQRNIIAQYGAQIEQLIAVAKQAAVGFFADAPIADVLTWHALADHYDINGLDETDDMEEIVAIAQEAYRRSLDETNVIDFNDMILLPLIKNLRVKYTKDRIFLDEAQDLSRARQALAKKFLRPGSGRMYVIGDDRQAIYGFSGADAQALKNLTTSLDAVELPLSVTWRCPKSVVALAQTIVRDIEHAPTAKDGTVETITELPADLKPGDAILCRTNAPLVTTAYQLIRKGIPAKVEGRSIGAGLEALARRWKVSSIAALLDKLDDYKAREVQKALARDNEAKAQEVADRVETLVEICNACTMRGHTQVADVIGSINVLFGDDVNPKECVTLCSMHRSKGREWKRVIILRKQIKRQMQAWQRVQEENLVYVAYTRAMETLLFMDI